jgi:DNA modification methylase
MTTDYASFLDSKVQRVQEYGFVVSETDLAPILFPFQKHIVRWALRVGRAAIFAECGLGKTFMQLEWARHVAQHTGGRVLILAPLAVGRQTVREAERMGLAVEFSRGESAATIVVTNYEQLDNFNPGDFAGVVLDESSILKNYTGKYKQALIERFAATPFRLACTATPAPNDHLELGNHADFLGVMGSNEMIARWFVNDSMSAGSYRLKGHAEDDFWRWVTTWAVCVGKPSDLGYSDDGFILPGLEFVRHAVASNHARAWEKGQLFHGALTATGLWEDKRETLDSRVAKAAELANATPGAVIVWCDTNDESTALAEAIPGSVEVRGADSVETKERKLNAFSSGEARVIVTKAEIAGLGLNWQHAATQVFVGLAYSFERFYQALRRSYRFGQKSVVRAHIICSDSEGAVIETIERKRVAHEEMVSKMNAATRSHGTSDSSKGVALRRIAGEVERGEGWEVRLGDCVEVLRDVPADSVHLSVFSPPFSNLYVYSDALADMGNSADHAEFFRHYGFLARELHRVIVPGRNVCVHCKDLPLYKNRDGAAGLYDFPGDIIRTMESVGFTFHSRVTIWKDPVTEMQRTKNHGLLHKNFESRREVVRMGVADYLLVFRKWTPGMADKQVTEPAVPGEYIGENPPPSWKSQRDWSIQTWQKYASPVWMDIRQARVLGAMDATDERDEKHICPLQLDVIERCVWLYSNRGDLVLSPFSGIGSEGVVSTTMGRRYLGVELKRSYWKQSIVNLRNAEAQRRQIALFPAAVAS